jgi:hypothetical protein
LGPPIDTLVVDEGKWVDLDASPASVSAPAPTQPGPSFSLAFGPDNVVPYNSARIWVSKSSGSCTVQAKQSDTPSGYAEVRIADRLQRTPTSFVRLCTETPIGNVFALSITSKSSNTRAPYGVEYKRD